MIPLNPASDVESLSTATPLGRILSAAATLPNPPDLLVDLLNGRVGVPGGVLAALELDTNLRGALLAAVRLRHGAVSDLTHAWMRLGNATMLGHLVDTALVLHLDRLPEPLAPAHTHRFQQSFAVAGALRELARQDGLDPHLAMATGALHGVGEVAIEHALRQISPNVSGRLALGETCMSTVEQALRISRFQVGASMLAMQGLPAALWQAIGRQGEPTRPLDRLLQTARRAAQPENPLKGYAAVAASDAVQRAERLRRVLCGR